MVTARTPRKRIVTRRENEGTLTEARMPEPRSPASRTHLLLAAIVAVTSAVHGRAIGFGFSYLDDDALIIDQQQARAPAGGL